MARRCHPALQNDARASRAAVCFFAPSLTPHLATPTQAAAARAVVSSLPPGERIALFSLRPPGGGGGGGANASSDPLELVRNES